MKHQRVTELYLRMYTELNKWINECPIYHSFQKDINLICPPHKQRGICSSEKHPNVFLTIGS